MSKVRRSANVPRSERSPDREFAFPAHRPRQNQIRDVGAGDNEHQNGSCQQHPKNRPRLGRELIPQQLGVDAEIRFRRVGLRVLLDDRRMNPAQFGAGGIQIGPGRKAGEEFRHAMDPPRYHRGG